MRIEWDDGNWPKCGKHGVSRQEIEDLLSGTPEIFWDSEHSQVESRLRAIGRVGERSIFVAFTWRVKDGDVRLRPVSARYMHAKEVKHYEQAQARKRPPSH